MTTLRLELGIDAQRMIQQIMVHSRSIEEQAQKGIELAIDEICKEDVFVLGVKNETLKQLHSIVSQHVLSWEVKNKISKLIEQKIGEKIEAYAETIAEKIVIALK